MTDAPASVPPPFEPPYALRRAHTFLGRLAAAVHRIGDLATE